MVKKCKAIYVGVNGKPVKVWDKENGILDTDLYAYVVDMIASGEYELVDETDGEAHGT